jgi:hypothetical protein
MNEQLQAEAQAPVQHCLSSTRRRSRIALIRMLTTSIVSSVSCGRRHEISLGLAAQFNVESPAADAALSFVRSAKRRSPCIDAMPAALLDGQLDGLQ